MLRKLFKKILCLAVRLYQVALSPYLGPSCRFQPTCSNYALEAINNHNLAKALKLIFIRLSKCHPLGRFGFDPVPKGEKNETN